MPQACALFFNSFLFKADHLQGLVVAAADVLKPLPGLSEYLDWIKSRGIKTAAVTNAPKLNAEVMLKAVGLENFFEHLILGELFEFPKPYPDPYLAAVERCGLQREDCLIHEDSPAGMVPAHSWLHCSHQAAKLSAYGRL